MAGEEMSLCQPGGDGALFLGRTDWEQGSNYEVRAMVYLIALLYCFMGVNTAADYFMSGVEQITSARRRIPIPGTDRYRTYKVWNDAVKNLTLLALGSSAPEIMLSCIEVTGNGFFSGALGPGTIVGSAAFNLFVIIAVCVYSIPEGEFRAIRAMSVYHVTVIFSILAYIWLLVIVDYSSKDIIEVWEAVVTLMFFFLLVVFAFFADKGKFPCLALDRKTVVPPPPKEASSSPKALPPSPGPAGPGPGDAAAGPPLPLPSMKEDAVAEQDDRDGKYHMAAHPRARVSRPHRRQSATSQDTSQAEKVKFTASVMETKGQPMGAKQDGKIYENGAAIKNRRGVLTFWRDTVDMEVRANPISYEVEILRRNGSQGKVGCKVRTVPLTAVPEYNFLEISKRIEFDDGETSQRVAVNIKPKRPHQKTTSFQLCLEDPTGGCEFNPNLDGDDDEIFLTFNLINAHFDGTGSQRVIDRVVERLFKPDSIFYGLEMWMDQIISVFNVDDDDEDDEDEDSGDEGGGGGPAWTDYILHIITLPWKVFFALLCPPSSWLGGWLLFGCALVYIGFVTAFITDLASLFGCCVKMPDEITAITIVALGTSLPDMFASMSAAKDDEDADASVVNVTGSNSVNVFLGIGLPWTVSSMYWEGGLTEEWKHKYSELLVKYPSGGFVVMSGNLGFSVLIFVNLAVTALCILRIRRLRCGGELGGPFRSKVFSAISLLILWCLYVGSSIMQVKGMEMANTIKWPIVAITIAAVLLVIVVEILGPVKYETLWPPEREDDSKNQQVDPNAEKVVFLRARAYNPLVEAQVGALKGGGGEAAARAAALAAAEGAAMTEEASLDGEATKRRRSRRASSSDGEDTEERGESDSEDHEACATNSRKGDGSTKISKKPRSKKTKSEKDSDELAKPKKKEKEKDRKRSS